MPPTEHHAMLSAMARYIPIAHTVVAFRRRAWEEAGGYPDVPNLVDLRFWLRVAKTGWHFATVPEVLGEHNVHASSFFHQTFRYVERQRDLARVQAQIVRELKLPTWMYAYSVGRHAYAYLPHGLKRALRQRIGGFQERDV
jgi:GT2 family glycosyltransferase